MLVWWLFEAHRVQVMTWVLNHGKDDVHIVLINGSEFETTVNEELRVEWSP